jgi:group II intron reverse transcriptase/maturase
MNLNAAYKQVRQNKGSGGVDRMDVGSLKDYLVRAKEELTASIERGKYRPNPVRRAEIPKGNRKRRELGIPTVVVRVIQQGIAQQLSLLYDPGFSPHSFGFRPKRSTYQALGKCRNYIREGYVYAVDIDLERFFDTVNHSKLTEELSRKIKDGRVISFIHYIKG